MTVRRPDLQELVAACGRYDRIPPEAWEQYDRDVAAWQARVRHGGLHGSGPTVPQIEPPSPFSTDYLLCAVCRKPGDFGYRDPATKQIKWFCAEHRLAEHWADVHRQVG